MYREDALPIASTQKRVGAFMIDDMMIAFLILVIFFDQLSAIASHLPSVITAESIENFKQEMNQFSVDNLLLIVSLKIMYHTFFVWQNGKTLGKYFMKIKVINLDSNQTPSLAKALLRASLRVLSEVFFYLGFVMALFMPLKQTFHDKFSKSVVIHD